ncbi:TRAP transporter substrate-binding protein [Acuticoccus kandeliae]|uniref:TRAP transporter substrate-binding protein n=1 Tax=Acuticoccus kandeliae TaxID=2073160 RepID=UPI000D3ED66C|nr:TRAP transporter substrate-binding protein [Acuticoccus kandeliae]
MWTPISRRVALACALTTSLVLVSPFAEAAETIRIGFASGAVGPHASGANGFKEKLEELAPGRFKVEIFPGGSLGGEREMAESVQLGSLEMAITGTAVLGNFVPDMMIADIPFLFRDYDHARAVMDGPVGQELMEKMRQVGLVGLGFGEVGFRHITNNDHAVDGPEDMHNLKIRTMENNIHIEAFRQLGAQPTPMSWTEVLTGLEQGTIDGQENPLSIIVSAKLWETQDYLSLTKHAFTPVAFYMSPTFFDALSAEDQEIMREAVKAGQAANRAYVDESERTGLATIKEHGVQVDETPDMDAFRAAMAPLYEKYRGEFGSLIDEIQAQ